MTSKIPRCCPDDRKDLAVSLVKFVPTSASKFTYNCSASAAELNGNIKSQRGILRLAQYDTKYWGKHLYYSQIIITFHRAGCGEH